MSQRQSCTFLKKKDHIWKINWFSAFIYRGQGPAHGRVALHPACESDSCFSGRKNTLGHVSAVSVTHLETPWLFLEALSSPTNLRTAGLRLLGVLRGYHEGRLQEGCNWWLTGDRYRLLRSGSSRRGLARWGGIPWWDRGEPADQSVGPAEFVGKFWEQKVALAVSDTKVTPQMR